MPSPAGLTSDAEVRIDGQSSRGIVTATFLVEMDRGTQPVDIVVNKVRQYVDLRNYRTNGSNRPNWAESYRLDPQRPYNGFPTVLFCFGGPNPDSARRRRDAIARILDVAADDKLAAAATEEHGVWILLTVLADVAPATHSADAYGIHYLNPHTGTYSDPWGNDSPRTTISDRTVTLGVAAG